MCNHAVAGAGVKPAPAILGMAYKKILKNLFVMKNCIYFAALKKTEH